jgi:hypothetical protein
MFLGDLHKIWRLDYDVTNESKRYITIILNVIRYKKELLTNYVIKPVARVWEKIQVEYISHYFPLVVQENGIDKKKQYIKYNDSNSLTASRAIARALQLVIYKRKYSNSHVWNSNIWKMSQIIWTVVILDRSQ